MEKSMCGASSLPAEQNRIISEIEKQLAKTKELEEHVVANQGGTEDLLKALLWEAFEGGGEYL
jgi:type I restriction enzyme, S subunit